MAKKTTKTDPYAVTPEEEAYLKSALKDIETHEQFKKAYEEIGTEIEEARKEREKTKTKAEETYKELEASEKEWKKYWDEIFKKLKPPELAELPTPPIKPDLEDIWSGFSNLARIIINLALILTAIGGGGEAYLVAFNNFVDAVRTRKKEEWEDAVKEFETLLNRAKAENDKKIQQYNINLELAKLGDEKAKDWITINQNKVNYWLTLADYYDKTISALFGLYDKLLQREQKERDFEERRRHNIEMEKARKEEIALRAKSIDVTLARLGAYIKSIKDREVQNQIRNLHSLATEERNLGVATGDISHLNKAERYIEEAERLMGIHIPSLPKSPLQSSSKGEKKSVTFESVGKETKF